MTRNEEQITKLKGLLDEAIQILLKIKKIEDYLYEHDEDEEQIDFDSRIECCDETADNFNLKIDSLRDAINQWISNEIVFADVDVASIASLDDEDDALESFDIANDDEVEFDWLFEQLDDVAYRLSECVSNYEDKFSDAFNLSDDEIDRILTV